MKITTHDFPFENRDITVRIAIPENQTGILPYMIVHDAQNFFDVWEEERTKTDALAIVENLINKNIIPPIAIVGVDSWKDITTLERFTDFSPWVSSEMIKYLPSLQLQKTEGGGRGDAYADFIVQTLVPFLEVNYNIGKSFEKRGIMGQSLGAMITLYITSKYPEFFSKIGLMSPALWCFETGYTNYLPHIGIYPKNTKIYMDIGRKESSDPLYPDFPKKYLDGAFFIYNILQRKTPAIQFTIDPEGEHSMKCIKKHFPMMISYLWGNNICQ